MRVQYWADGFWPYIGGIEVRSSKLLRALRKRGHEFQVITSHLGIDLPDEDLFGDIPVHRFAFWHALQPGDMEQLMRVRNRIVALKRTFEPDLVHIDSVGPSVFFHLSTLQVQSAPLLVTIQHGLLPVQDLSRDSVVWKILEAADWITFCSQAARTEMRRRVAGISSPMSVIYNGTEVSPTSPAALSFDSPNLVCLGRLVECKGFDLALRAFAQLVDSFPDATLTVGGDGPAREELEAQAIELGIAESVRFTGWIPPDQVPSLINEATVVLVPSRFEAFGLVAAEAALMSRPVVATRVGGLPEVVVDGQTGLLVEPEDAAAFATKIASLLSQPDEARRMGQAARRRALSMFNWEDHINAYDTLYHKLQSQIGVTREKSQLA